MCVCNNIIIPKQVTRIGPMRRVERIDIGRGDSARQASIWTWVFGVEVPGRVYVLAASSKAGECMSIILLCM